MELHESCALFPAMEGAELEELVDSIRRNGLREPITTYQGLIVDGRNRYVACGLAGVEPRCEEWDGAGSLLDFVFDKNWNRRQLSPSQRAMTGAEYKPLAAKEAKERQLSTLKQNAGTVPAFAPERESGESRDISAKKFGVGSNYLGRAERVLKKDTRMAEDVKSGRVSLPDAERELGLGRKARTDATMTINGGEGTEGERQMAQAGATMTINGGDEDRLEDLLWRADNEDRIWEIDRVPRIVKSAFHLLSDLRGISVKDAVKYASDETKQNGFPRIDEYVAHLQSIRDQFVNQQSTRRGS